MFPSMNQGIQKNTYLNLNTGTEMSKRPSVEKARTQKPFALKDPKNNSSKIGIEKVIENRARTIGVSESQATYHSHVLNDNGFSP